VADKRIKSMITQQKFEATISDFDNLEPTRSPLYGMGLNLLNAGFEVEAYLLILATWNFAYFRYILTKFDLEAFRRVIKNTDPIFQRLKKYKFELADFDALAHDIKSVYAPFKELVGQTGAAKLLHFKHPGLFVMWDTDIRRRFKIPNASSPDDFIVFLKKIKSEFGHIHWSRHNRGTLAKAIDEFNFVVAHRDKKTRKKKAPTMKSSVQ
jgi:hypothetical protein